MANELESLLSKSEINFPQRMTGSQVRDMFGYISKRGKYEIELRVEQTEKFRYEHKLNINDKNIGRWKTTIQRFIQFSSDILNDSIVNEELNQKKITKKKKK